jgi:hypothetical protein
LRKDTGLVRAFDVAVGGDRRRAIAVVASGDAEIDAGDSVRAWAGRDREIRAFVPRVDAGEAAAGDIAIGLNIQRPAKLRAKMP